MNTLYPKPVDIFVNNAGINTNWGWRKCMEVNILAVMSATEKALEAMKNRNGDITRIAVYSIMMKYFRSALLHCPNCRNALKKIRISRK